MRVQVENLKKGMFVQELDRPWADTPFLLQGFMIESDEDLGLLRTHCRFVVIDAARSAATAVAGLALAPKPKEDKATTSPRSVGERVIIYGAEKKSAPLLKDIKGGGKESANDAQDTAPADSAEPIVTYREKNSSARGKTFDQSSTNDDVEETAESGDPLIHKERAQEKRGGLFKQIGSLLFGKEKKNPEEDAAPPPVKAAHTPNPAEPMVVAEGGRIVPSRELQEARVARDNVRAAVKSVVEDIRRDRNIDVEKVHEAVDSMVESVSKSPDALIWLTRLKDRDSYAYDHGIDVSIYMLSFARHLGYPRAQMHALGMAGLLLDVGKLRMPRELLEKQARLTPAEFSLMKTHVAESLSILKDTADITPEIAQVVAQHHERMDGSGYPNKLTGESISLFGAMAAIVDSFEAITSDRPYATAVSTHQALQNLNTWKAKLFHEGLVEQFMQCVGIFPVGSLVELNTGEVGIVTAQNKIRRLRPKLMLVLDSSKRPQSFPVMLDLNNDPAAPDGTVYMIKRDLPIGMYGIDAREYYL